MNKNFTYQNLETILNNNKKITEIKNKISEGNLIIIKNTINKKTINRVKKYLISIARNSLPYYQKIEISAPNHHRIIRSDKRSHVTGSFHQFSFFPWNQDVFNFFNIFKKGYHLKNLLSENHKNKYLGNTPEDHIIARICFQFYPAGEGYLNMHSDPVGKHQITAPILIMSKKNKKNGDFKDGGSYVINNNKKKVYIEEFADIGDIILYDASMAHGVDLIDPKSKNHWLDFKGRWMMLFATNKLNNADHIKESIDLEK